MQFIVRSAAVCRNWAKHPMRRAALLALALLLTCSALFGIGQLQAYQTMPLVKPYHHAGNRTGALLIHGFGGSPVEVQPLADALARAGYTVDVPVLPGHGTTPRDFGATTNAQYLSAVRSSLHELRSGCDRVFVVGFSMGGLLALQLEQESKLDGLVLLSTPIQPWNDHADFDWLKWAAVNGARIHLFVPTLGIPSLMKLARRELGETPPGLIEPNYAAYPAASCLQVLELIETVKPRVGSVAAPTLIVHSRDDRVSAPSSADYLFEHLGCADKRLVYLQDSGHVIALGRERERVNRLVMEFVESGSPR